MNADSAGLLALPTEIMNMILSRLNNSDLYHLLLTSRELAYPALSHLYRTLEFDNLGAFSGNNLLTALGLPRRDPTWRQYVRKLVIDDGVGCAHHPTRTQEMAVRGVQRLKLMLGRLQVNQIQNVQ